jgi:hypothetical protein
MNTPSNWAYAKRLGGLRRFAIAISILNILGHTVLGFEQAWATPLVALASAYFTELLLEWLDARASGRGVKFGGGPARLVDFLLSAHITGLAVGMLLYAGEQLWPIAFAASAAIVSKAFLRVRKGTGTTHFLNPSNFGISLTLLLFPWIGIAQPYQFTEHLPAAGDIILPAVIVCSGTFLNARFTGRLPLIATWLLCFVAQASLRHWLLGARIESALLPMTGVAFILYTFYMVTDPATTPSTRRGQITFGAAVAFTYGLLMVCHVVFGLFFALSIVCVVRGLILAAQSRRGARPTPPVVPMRRAPIEEVAVTAA